MREREKYFVSKAHEKNIKVTQQANNYIGGGSESSCCYGNRPRRSLNVKKKNYPPPFIRKLHTICPSFLSSYPGNC